MENGIKVRMAVVVVVLGFLATLRGSEAQASTSCTSSLVPCASYINATNPPASCCNPLKSAIATQKACLCAIFNNPTLLKSFGIKASDAVTLATRCKIAGADPEMCSALAPSPTTATATATPTTTTTTTPAESGKNGADIVAWSGISFVLASVVASSMF